jgi:hypothetical protein
MFHVNSIGTMGRNQMFFVTFVNHYFGLSRDGINFQAKFGYGVNLNMFDTQRKIHTTMIQARVRSLQAAPHVQWLDNFSKFRRHSAPTIAKDVFSSCLWTGSTINEYVGPPVDVAVRYNQAGSVICAMPDNILDTREAVSNGIRAIHDEGAHYFPVSLVKKYNILNVPLKIDVAAFPSMSNVVNCNKNTTKQINPYKLIKLNIGSNRGLIGILRQMQEDNRMHLERACQEYKTLNLDENIFYRTLKVRCYCIRKCCIGDHNFYLSTYTVYFERIMMLWLCYIFLFGLLKTGFGSPIHFVDVVGVVCVTSCNITLFDG